MENNNLQVLDQLSLICSDKKTRKAFCAHVLEQIEEGYVDALRVHTYIKNMEAILDTFTDEKKGYELATRYKASLLTEAEKYGKQFEKYNATFQIKEAGTKLDWTVCNDIVLNELLDLQKATDKLIKNRQEYLRTLPAKGVETVDEETGEVVMLYPPAKSSTTTVSVSLA
jgi:hypothetical protein